MMKTVLCWFLILSLICGYSPPADALIEIDGVTTAETITTQSVTDDELITPYHITGESLVQLMQKMVNFNIPNSNVIFNRRTAQLFVRNTPTNQDVIEKVLSDLRKANNKQVEIEARIITISSGNVEDLGLDFLGLDAINSKNSTRWGTDPNFGDGNYTTNIDFPNTTDIGGNNEGGQLSFAVMTSHFDIQGYIDALKTRAVVNNVAAPRLIVANNQRAHIKVEEAEYYIQSLETDVEELTNLSVAIDPEIGIAESGTILDVTPTINTDGTVSLELHPQFVTADLSNEQIINVSDVLDETQQPKVTLPVFISQSADTTITIENGGVALIGGLIQESEVKENFKIPFLGDIPVIGRLCFQKSQLNEVKIHLVIFVKATIRKIQA